MGDRHKVIVNSPNVKYEKDYIESAYRYTMSTVSTVEDKFKVTPTDVSLNIRTDCKLPRLGVMFVGWGGNNGTTVTAAILANKHGISWETKNGLKTANWLGSITQSSTVKLGMDAEGKDVYAPLSSLVPLVNPNNIVIDGWDISSDNLATAMQKAKVLDYNLQQKLIPLMKDMKPRSSIFFPEFVAANQACRADNVVLCCTKREAFDKVREDIYEFKNRSRVDKVVVLWTANTEKMCDVVVGKNDTANNLLKAINDNYEDISASTLFAVAAILEKCIYINGSPQNTLVPGCVELAERHGAFIAGDDFKSGQTKLKSVLVDFLVSAGIKPVSIVSYNHLGNNDGRNLSAPLTFKSKEISKSSVIDDIIESNPILYKPNEKPDHCVVIKYVPYVGDSKRALDEYISEICLGGLNTISIHNTCEDSLLASPIILDLVILAEFCSRVQFSTDTETKPVRFNAVLSILSYLLKAPLLPKGAPLVNSLFKQRACIENVLKACIGLPPDHNMTLEHKLPKKLFPLPVQPEAEVVSVNQYLESIPQYWKSVPPCWEYVPHQYRESIPKHRKFPPSRRFRTDDGKAYPGVKVEPTVAVRPVESTLAMGSVDEAAPVVNSNESVDEAAAVQNSNESVDEAAAVQNSTESVDEAVAVENSTESAVLPHQTIKGYVCHK